MNKAIFCLRPITKCLDFLLYRHFAAVIMTNMTKVGVKCAKRKHRWWHIGRVICGHLTPNNQTNTLFVPPERKTGGGRASTQYSLSAYRADRHVMRLFHCYYCCYCCCCCCCAAVAAVLELML